MTIRQMCKRCGSDLTNVPSGRCRDCAVEQGRPLDLPHESALGALTHKGEPLISKPSVAKRTWIPLTAFLVGQAMLLVGSYKDWPVLLWPGCAAMVLSIAADSYANWRFHWRPRVRLAERTLDHDLALCLRCGNALRETDPSGACQQCDQSYVLDETRDLWRTWLRAAHLADDGDFAYRARARNRRTCLRCGHELASAFPPRCPACDRERQLNPIRR